MARLVGGYDVIVAEREGNTVLVSFDEDMKSIYMEMPGHLTHPCLDAFFDKRLSRMIENRKLRSNAASFVVKRRDYDLYKFNVRKLDYEIKQEYGDISKRKDDWDYNLAPTKGEGKFGDLKSFLEMRKGGTLNLTGA